MNKTKILFDGNCIVCDLEISHYKRIAPETFELIDISDEKFKAEDYQLTAEDVNTNMHVITPEKELKIGVDAFAQIWSQIPKYNKYSRLIKKPVIFQLAKLGYKFFTIIRPFLPKKN